MSEISATVLTLNEEENIEDCLKTLQWCDEVIVVDSYSEDKTTEIAEKYADKIYQKESPGYSEPLRSFAAEKSSGDWILMIDADERVPKTLANRLQELSEREELDVINIGFRDYMLGQLIDFAGWQNHYQRIMYRPESVGFSDRIHHFAEFDEDSEILKLEDCPEYKIVHFNHYGFEDILAGMNKYTTIEAKQVEFSLKTLLTYPPKKFISKFFAKGGWRNGLKGFTLSLTTALYFLIVQMKAWEFEKVGCREDYEKTYQTISKNIVEEHTGEQREG